ncbi:MAG: M23 family metallopeptidase, partial [Rhodospirillales bacterium]|nr:M23 family metallopeptidase [Rhodospirillales bacterium]
MRALGAIAVVAAIVAVAMVAATPPAAEAQMGERGKLKGGKKGGRKPTPPGGPGKVAADTNPEIIGAFIPTRANLDAMRIRGFLETGLAPVYPDDADCPLMTSAFGVATRSDGSQRSRRFYQGRHGGFDIPADEGTPILALADGTVVTMGEGAAIGGLAIVLQHAPEDTGLDVWTYTEYKHIQELPPLTIGQRVAMGELIARAGKTGTTGGYYGADGFSHLHMTAFFSTGGEYEIGHMLIPVGGQWMDPMAFFRRAPVESVNL